MKRHRWNDKFYVRAYQLAREGLSDKGIAKTIGVDPATFRSWCRTDDALADAVQQGRELGGDKGKTFADYVLGKLPEDLQATWSEIVALNEEGNAEKRIEGLLANKGRRFKQHLFVTALVSSNFSAFEACNKVGLPYSTYSHWLKHDPDFAGIFDHILEMKKDFVEGCLMGLVKQGDSAATIFASRTLNRDRGYDPKLTVEHTGQVQHSHVLSLETIIPQLSPKAQREILAAIEKAEAKQLPAHEEVEDAEYEVA